MSRLMTASTSSGRVRSAAVRSRSLVSMVRTRCTSAVAVIVESSILIGTSAGAPVLGSPLLDRDRDGQVVPGVVIDDQDGGEERPAPVQLQEIAKESRRLWAGPRRLWPPLRGGESW